MRLWDELYDASRTTLERSLPGILRRAGVKMWTGKVA